MQKIKTRDYSRYFGYRHNKPSLGIDQGVAQFLLFSVETVKTDSLFWGRLCPYLRNLNLDPPLLETYKYQ